MACSVCHVDSSLLGLIVHSEALCIWLSLICYLFFVCVSKMSMPKISGPPTSFPQIGNELGRYNHDAVVAVSAFQND